MLDCSLERARTKTAVFNIRSPTQENMSTRCTAGAVTFQSKGAQYIFILIDDQKVPFWVMVQTKAITVQELVLHKTSSIPFLQSFYSHRLDKRSSEALQTPLHIDAGWSVDGGQSFKLLCAELIVCKTVFTIKGLNVNVLLSQGNK